MGVEDQTVHVMLRALVIPACAVTQVQQGLASALEVQLMPFVAHVHAAALQEAEARLVGAGVLLSLIGELSSMVQMLRQMLQA